MAEGHTHHEDMTRRKFLHYGINAIGGLMTLILAVPFAGYFLSPVLRRGKGGAEADAWKLVGPASDITDVPKQYNVSFDIVDGYIKSKKDEAIFIYKDGAGEVVALDNTCSHLGCPVHWDTKEDNFICPCHFGKYTKDGKNVPGTPPPAPLARYATKVEGNNLYVKGA